jgi:hypothetical protein
MDLNKSQEKKKELIKSRNNNFLLILQQILDSHKALDSTTLFLILVVNQTPTIQNSWKIRCYSKATVLRVTHHH